MTLLGDVTVWTTACPYDRLLPNRGVGVLLPDGVQAALFSVTWKYVQKAMGLQ